jgi:putative tryptophan/tyrosine transport system substrate-binding protein
MMRRREFITLLGGAAAAWPLAARAQPPERVRRVSVLMNYYADDPDAQARLASFLRGMRQLGWSDGLNVQIDVRWTAGERARIRSSVADLVAAAPDVIFAPGSPAVALLRTTTNKIPIIFAGVVDPVGAGFVASMPGQAAT